MVVIGHSQGGLLAKMTAIDSGTELWDTISQRPLDELILRDDNAGTAPAHSFSSATSIRAPYYLHRYSAPRQL